MGTCGKRPLPFMPHGDDLQAATGPRVCHKAEARIALRASVAMIENMGDHNCGKDLAGMLDRECHSCVWGGQKVVRFRISGRRGLGTGKSAGEACMSLRNSGRRLVNPPQDGSARVKIDAMAHPCRA
jgi:hypothetical protein